MRAFHLRNGRETFLVRWAMVRTYAGQLEGTVTTISEHLRRGVQQRATQVLAPASPLGIVPATAGDLPEWFCVAELESNRGVSNSDSDYNSRMFAAWFMSGTDRSIDDNIESIVLYLDWEHVAEDYDIMMF